MTPARDWTAPVRRRGKRPIAKLILRVQLVIARTKLALIRALLAGY